jgi:hypothetical protein
MEPREQPAPGDAVILPNSQVPFTISYAPRELTMRTISDAELDALATGGASIHLGFLGMTFGSFVSFAVVIGTVDLKSPIQHMTFVGLTWISAILMLYFAAMAYRDFKAARTKVAEIKSSPH